MKAKKTLVNCINTCSPFYLRKELEKSNNKLICGEKTLVIKDIPLTQALIVSVLNLTRKITMQITQIKKQQTSPSGLNHIILVLKD